VVSLYSSFAIRTQQRRWLTTIVVVLALLAASFAVTLATLPHQSHRLELGRPMAIRTPPIRGTSEELLINAAACPTATACSAAGFVSTTATSDAVVVDESNGVWQRAEVIEGTATRDVGNNATINALSCASPGNCSAGGSFVNGAGLSHEQFFNGDASTTAFVVNEVAGTWRGAHAVTGVVAPGIEEGAAITFVSCTSAGNCAAAGRFASVGCADGDNTCVLAGATYKRQFEKSFVVNEVHGVWGQPQWLRDANRGEYPTLNGLSCGAPGSCAVVGTSESPSGEQEGFVVNEVGGKWQRAALFPATELTGQTSSQLYAVSCGSRGNCTAGGSYTYKYGDTSPFLVDETAGTWRRPIVAKGSSGADLNGYAQIQSISCATSNECTAFGEALSRDENLNYFVLTNREGTWSSARLVPGMKSTAFQGYGGSEMACSASQSCVVAGSYFTSLPSTTPYALTENDGHFSRVKNLRGVARLDLAPTAGDVVALSCGASNDCLIVEFFASFNYDSSFLVQMARR
jgi:hypothetical protein